MTPTEQGLIDAILAAPDDDLEPRRIYADFLIDEGGPRARWGELILIECQLARTPKRSPRYFALIAAKQAREDARPFHVITHFGAIGFRTAIPQRLDTRLRRFLEHVDQRFAEQPLLDDLRLTSFGDEADGQIERLAAIPQMRQIRRLRIESATRPEVASFGDRAALALAGSPHLTNLRRLVLRRHAIGAAGAIALRERFAEVSLHRDDSIR